MKTIKKNIYLPYKHTPDFVHIGNKVMPRDFWIGIWWIQLTSSEPSYISMKSIWVSQKIRLKQNRNIALRKKKLPRERSCWDKSSSCWTRNLGSVDLKMGSVVWEILLLLSCMFDVVRHTCPRRSLCRVNSLLPIFHGFCERFYILSSFYWPK